MTGLAGLISTEKLANPWKWKVNRQSMAGPVPRRPWPTAMPFPST